MDPRLELVTDRSQLSSANNGMAEFHYEEVAPRPLTTGDAFFNSEIRFSYTNSGAKRSMESMSYLRMRLDVGSGADVDNIASFIEEEMIAPVMNPCSTLFQKCEFLAGGQSIVNVSENLPQVSTLENRIMLSKAQLDGSESSLTMMDSLFEARQAKVVSDSSGNPKQYLKAAGWAYQIANIDPDADTLAFDGTDTFTYVDNAGGDLDLTLYYKDGDFVELCNVYDSGGGVGAVGTARVRAEIGGVTATTFQIVGAGTTLGAFPVAGVANNNALFNIRKVQDLQTSNIIELCWRPPLGMFNLDYTMATPAGKYELVLQPNPAVNAKRAFFQSLGIASADVPNYNIKVIDVKLMLAKVTTEFVKDATVMMDLHETRCQVQRIPNGGGASQVQLDYIVPESTQALTVALQDSRSQNDTRYPSTQFTVGNEVEMTLNQYYVQYADMVRPQRIPNLTYQVVDNVVLQNTFVEPYLQSISQTKALYSPGSAETWDDWKARGPYFFLSYPRSGEDKSTVANVYLKFNNSVDNTNVLLFSHSKKIVTLEIRDSAIERVAIDYC